MCRDKTEFQPHSRSREMYWCCVPCSLWTPYLCVHLQQSHESLMSLYKDMETGVYIPNAMGPSWKDRKREEKEIIDSLLDHFSMNRQSYSRTKASYLIYLIISVWYPYFFKLWMCLCPLEGKSVTDFSVWDPDLLLSLSRRWSYFSACALVHFVVVLQWRTCSVW